MEIVAFFQNSLKAWPGRKSSVVYAPGCNFECSFCYAHSIIKNHERLERIPQEKIVQMLLDDYEQVDSVVLSGGEPLMQGKKLLEFLELLKAEGFYTKLDTNGGNSLLLEKALSQGLVDFVSLDLKNRLNDYIIDLQNYYFDKYKKYYYFYNKIMADAELRAPEPVSAGP